MQNETQNVWHLAKKSFHLEIQHMQNCVCRDHYRPTLMPCVVCACVQTETAVFKNLDYNENTLESYKRSVLFMASRHGPCSTQRQARELISGPDPAMRARLLSFNRTQTRVVIGLLTGHNTVRRHLHIMGLCYDPMCRKCGTEEETSVHILCECEALASLRHAYLGSFFLDPEDIRELGMGGGHLELCQGNRAPIA